MYTSIVTSLQRKRTLKSKYFYDFSGTVGVAPKINFVFREIKVKIVAKFRGIKSKILKHEKVTCFSKEKTRFL
jgi:hypothetical protein